jgi:hypothetical protein
MNINHLDRTCDEVSIFVKLGGVHLPEIMSSQFDFNWVGIILWVAQDLCLSF